MNTYFGYRRKRLDRELSAGAPRADEGFVDSLAREVGVARPSHRGSRRVFAGAFTAVVVGALVSFAGVGLAATGSHKAVPAVKSSVTSETSAQGQYANQAPIRPAAGVKGAYKSTVAATKPATTSGTLPFTGFSLIGTLALGGALLGVGLLLRRRENRK
jgi:hypothetical protein